MTAATLRRAARPGSGQAEGHYGFRSVAQMEWLKLRSVRSTWCTLLVFAAGLIGIAILVLAHQDWATMSAARRASFDPTNDSYAGMLVGQLAIGVLGVLAITSEFSPRLIAVQACACAGVGSAKASLNQARVASLKPSRAGLITAEGAGMYPSCLALPTA